MSEGQNPKEEISTDEALECMRQREQQLENELNYSHKAYSEGAERSREFMNRLVQALGKTDTNFEKDSAAVIEKIKQSMSEYIKNSKQ